VDPKETKPTCHKSLVCDDYKQQANKETTIKQQTNKKEQRTQQATNMQTTHIQTK
jgi:hypothetical protein